MTLSCRDYTQYGSLLQGLHAGWLSPTRITRCDSLLQGLHECDCLVKGNPRSMALSWRGLYAVWLSSGGDYTQYGSLLEGITRSMALSWKGLHAVWLSPGGDYTQCDPLLQGLIDIERILRAGGRAGLSQVRKKIFYDYFAKIF